MNKSKLDSCERKALYSKVSSVTIYSTCVLVCLCVNACFDWEIGSRENMPVMTELLK